MSATARSESSVYPLGPRGYPILGVLPRLRSDPIRTFLDAADRYGDIVHLKAGPYHGFLVKGARTYLMEADPRTMLMQMEATLTTAPRRRLCCDAKWANDVTVGA
jgi:hypothetical protein